MKKTVSWNGLIAMAGILAMSVLVFGCTDTQTTNVPNEGGGVLKIKGSIAGIVVDINNNPVEGARVSLRYAGLGAIQKTGGDGGYLFTGVPVSGQLGCQEDCDENPYLIVVKSPTTRVDGEQVTPYVTAYTAALLSFTSLQAIGAYENEGGTDGWQAVGDLQVQAVPAVMRRPNAIVGGYVVDTTTGLPASGALVTLNPSSDLGPPEASTILDSGQSTMAIGDPTTVTGTDGLFLFTSVPEGSDTWPVSYTVSVTAPSRQLCTFCDYPVVSVGTGNHEWWVDADCGDMMDGDDNAWNRSDAIALCPALPPSDSINPYVIATNLPPNSVITAIQADDTFCWTFNEPMNLIQGDGTIRQTGGGPIALNTALTGWNIPSVDSGCPEGTINNPVYAMTPALPLPEGRFFVFSLNNMEDLAGNQYAGRNPAGDEDAFEPDDPGAPMVAKNLRTGGDPDLMCVGGLSQDAALLDPMQPIGGLAGNEPQANNLNLLFLCADGDEIGDSNEEANWISLSWTAAAPCVAGEDGVVAGYNVYAENTGLGFDTGVPLLVGSTGAAWGDPPTSWQGYLWNVNEAIIDYNDSSPVPIPLVDPQNYFDDGFTLPMAITAVNNDMREGPYSEVAQVRDVVPPTVADQGDGFDETVPTGWPILVVGPDAVGLYPVEVEGADDIPGLGDPEVGDGNVYDDDRYAAWLATPRDLDICMNEDLLAEQTVTATLVPLGGGGETVVSASVTQPENDWLATDCDELAQVTAVMDNLAQAQQNDHIGILALDETGINASNPGTEVEGLLNGDSVAHLYDGLVPLITEGAVVAGAGALEIMVLTFAEELCVDPDPPAEPICDGFDVTDITNYYLNGSALAAPIEASVDEETGTLITLNAPAGFGVNVCGDNEVTNDSHLVLAEVEDLLGNSQDAPDPDALWFAVEDEMAPEECDGTDLDDEDCESQGFDSGTLACAGNCTFDITGCGTCGNNLVDGDEVCDGTDLDGTDCVDLGYGSGTLACAVDCSDFDETACVPVP